MEPSREFVENFLEHHGVKGMKWGVRKKDYKLMSKSDREKYRKKTRRERSTDKKKALERHASMLLDASVKSKDSIFISSVLPRDTRPTVMTGSDFVSMLATGSAFNPRATQVFAYADNPKGMAAKKFVDSEISKISELRDSRYVLKR